jgi:outer membrane lipoprotein SlyB
MSIMLRLSKIGLQHILQDHSMGIKKGTVQGNAVTHHVNKTISVMVEERKDDMRQFVIKR